ncbi:pyrimidine reductase family protein [soil metagenome]
MQRLLPQPTIETSVAEALGELRPWEAPPAERPRVLTNFVHSLDGQIAIDGSSRSLGSNFDTAMLVGLRGRVDAVMIGAGTMRAERYGRVIPDPAKRESREQLGLDGDPLMIIVSGRLDLPWDAELFTDGSGEVLIFTTSAKDPPETTTAVSVIRHETKIDLSAAMRHLRGELGIRALLCEGGPHLHGDLIEQGLADEIFVTHSPLLVGGNGPSFVGDLPPGERPLEIAWLLHEPSTGELFARYRPAES